MNYPSLYSAQRSALYNAWAESLHPRVAEIMLIQSTADANNRVLRLCEQCALDGIPVDEVLVLGRHEGVDAVMKQREQKGIKYVVGYKLADVEENRITPQSTNPADFKPFDLAGYIAGGGKGPRQLWVEDPTQSGPLFSLGIDATAYPLMVAQGLPPNGNPRQNWNQFTEYQSDTPGFNGALVRIDAVYGYRVPFGEKLGPGQTESQFRLMQHGQFERADKVDPNA